jgi:hypothetical protein
MGARGRQSVAAIETPVIVSSLPDHRPPPPDDLTEAQAAEWRIVVRRMPSDWFPAETHSLLAAYCAHVTTLRLLTAEVERFRPEWANDAEGLHRLDKLLAMREREARAMSAAATRLRLTPQSRYRASNAAVATARNLSGNKPPWERFA